MSALVDLEAENNRLRVRLGVVKNRLMHNTPSWAREWPGIKGAIEEIDAALEGGPLAQNSLALSHEIIRLRSALEFYADPWKHTDAVPDFYRDLDFGSTAEEALAPRNHRNSGGKVMDDLTWLRGQIVALCEDTEDRYAPIAERDIEGKQGAYARGRIQEAKSIRNAICEVVRERQEQARNRVNCAAAQNEVAASSEGDA
jgi:hypothetical protein